MPTIDEADRVADQFEELLGRLGIEIAVGPWLELFGSTGGRLAQNAPTTPGDQDSDRVFELLVALCFLPYIGTVDPDRGRGDNPDLLFPYQGQTWGIACKRLYSPAPERFRE